MRGMSSDKTRGGSVAGGDVHRRRDADTARSALHALGVLEPPSPPRRLDDTCVLRLPRADAPTAGPAAVRAEGGQRFTPSDAAPAGAEEDALARQAAMVLSALEAAGDDAVPRLTPMERRLRRIGRVSFRVRAELKLWADGEAGESWTLFTRDLDARAMGFICQDRLPLGYGGTITFPGVGGRREQVEVSVTRCRPTSAGWYEGALHFNRPQPWLLEELSEQ